MRIILITLILFQVLAVDAQEAELKWWNPEHAPTSCIEGQGWDKNAIGTYTRLPFKAESKVRKEVWKLSQNSAGLTIRFRCNSKRIVIRYTVSGGHSMAHMPATGVSGVDMYTKTADGDWGWCNGNYSFGDTIRYDYKNLLVPSPFYNQGREYRLYLPLYNTITSFEIGVPDGRIWEVLPQRHEKPIVIYGTSIAQGACASRPGMAWTSVLNRQLDWPVINLGFSGNGRLEEPLIDLMTEIDAKLYVMDCLPNMMPWAGITIEETYKRLITSVKQLRKQRPNIPILLTEHAGYSDGATNTERYELYSGLNQTIKKAYSDLLEAGVKNLYLLTKEEIAQDRNSFVDGTHPSDLGMMRYAGAYEQIIRQILKQANGEIVTTQPVTQRREADNYDWEQRHQDILLLNEQTPPRVCILGNSIVHYWSGEPKASFARGEHAWNNLFSQSVVRNMACGWDRIENVLWRINHDELDGFEARQIILMIGTNNLELNSDKEMLEGYKLLFKTIKEKQPKAKVLMVGILPRRNLEERIKYLNTKIARLVAQFEMEYCDPGKNLLTKENKINETLFSDGLHPNEKGYKVLGKGLMPYVGGNDYNTRVN